MSVSAAIAAYRAARQQMPFTKLHWGVANVVGIESALLIEIIQDWCDNNMVHQRRQYFHDDHWWTRGTYQAWETKYPSLGSARTLQRLLLKLESDGYVLSDQFHRGKDNTKFYRVNEEAIGELYLQAMDDFRKSIMPDWHDETEVSKPSCQIGTTSVPDCHGHHAKLARSSIYKQISKLDQLTDQSPLPPQEQSEGDSSKLSLSLAEESNPQTPTTLLDKPASTQPANTLCSRSIIPRGENENKSQKFLIEEIFEETGKVLNYGVDYKAWIQAEMGDVIAHYRRSGSAFNRGANDIHTKFKSYLALGGNNGKGMSMRAAEAWVLNCEKDPNRWPELRSMVSEWLLAEQSGDRHLNIAREVERSSRPAIKVNLNL